MTLKKNYTVLSVHMTIRSVATVIARNIGIKNCYRSVNVLYAL